MTEEQKQRRAETARRNGQKSRGPVSTDGKYRASLNAISTGKHVEVHADDLPAFVALLNCDDRRVYVYTFQSHLRQYRPNSEHERGLVRHLTAELFQYERTSMIENDALQFELDAVLREYPEITPDQHVAQAYKRAVNQDQLFRILERRKKGHLSAYEKFLRILSKTRKEFPMIPPEPVDITADSNVIEEPLPTPEAVAAMLALADQAKKEPSFQLPLYVRELLINKEVMQKVAPDYDVSVFLDASSEVSPPVAA